MAGKIGRLLKAKIDKATWSDLTQWKIGRGDVGETDPRNPNGSSPRMIWIHQGSQDDRKIAPAVLSSTSGIKYERASLARLIGESVWAGFPDISNNNTATLYVKELTEESLANLDGQTPIEQAINNALFTDPANLTNMRLEVTGTKEVLIGKGTYTRPSDSNTYQFNETRSGFGTGNDSIATLIGALTSGQHRVAWVTVARETGKIKVVASTAVTAVGALPQRSQLINTIFGISVTATYKRIVPIYLYYGQTDVAEADVYRQFDARLDSTAGASGGGTVGDVSGPVASTQYSVPTFDNTDGDQLRNNSGVLIDSATGSILTAASFVANGTGGAGYVELDAQSSAPSAPADGLRLYANNSDQLAWRPQDGFIRTIAGTLTGNQTYTLPDASGTVALTSDITTATALAAILAPLTTARNVIAAATTTIIPLTLQTTDNNTTNPLLRFLASNGSTVLASVGATGLATFAGINSTPIGATTPSTVVGTTITGVVVDGTTNAATTVLTLQHGYTGGATPAANFGTDLRLQGHTNPTSNGYRDMGGVESYWSDAVDGTRRSKTDIYAYNVSTKVVGITVDHQGFSGFGTASPTTWIDVTRNVNGGTYILVNNTTNGNAAYAGIQCHTTGGSGFTLFATSPTYSGSWQNASVIASDLTTIITSYGATGEIKFQTGSTSASNFHMVLDATGQFGIGKPSSIAAKLHVLTTDAATSSITNVAILGHNGGTVAAGFGTGLLFQAETSTTNDINIGRIRLWETTVTHASLATEGALSSYYNNSGTITERDVISWGVDSSGNRLFSVYDVTPVARATNAIAAAAFAGNTSGIVNDSATYGGYSMGQIAQALINVGILT